MDYRARFRCVAGCDGDFSLDEVIYECPELRLSASGGA